MMFKIYYSEFEKMFITDKIIESQKFHWKKEIVGQDIQHAYNSKY